MSTVFLDVDTQIDFLFPSGSLYVPGAEKLIPTLAALNRFAPRLISTVCLHGEDDAEFRVYPPHCIEGTVGQQKPASLLVPNQMIIEKQELDAFSNPQMYEIAADDYFVYGVATEVCVKMVASKLLELGKQVTIVRDAVQPLDSPAGESFLTQFSERGGNFTVSAELLAHPFARRAQML